MTQLTILADFDEIFIFTLKNRYLNRATNKYVPQEEFLTAYKGAVRNNCYHAKRTGCKEITIQSDNPSIACYVIPVERLNIQRTGTAFINNFIPATADVKELEIVLVNAVHSHMRTEYKFNSQENISIIIPSYDNYPIDLSFIDNCTSLTKLCILVPDPAKADYPKQSLGLQITSLPTRKTALEELDINTNTHILMTEELLLLIRKSPRLRIIKYSCEIQKAQVYEYFSQEGIGVEFVDDTIVLSR